MNFWVLVLQTVQLDSGRTQFFFQQEKVFNGSFSVFFIKGFCFKSVSFRQLNAYTFYITDLWVNHMWILLKCRLWFRMSSMFRDSTFITGSQVRLRVLILVPHCKQKKVSSGNHKWIPLFFSVHSIYFVLSSVVWLGHNSRWLNSFSKQPD